MIPRDVTAAILQAIAYQGATYIVIRGTGSPVWDGKWIQVEDLDTRLPVDIGYEDIGRVLCRPTGEVERRDDGMLAAVVRPSPELPQTP